MTKLESTPMPPQIARLPRTENGYPWPFMTSREDIRDLDPRVIMRCAAEHLCGICGDKLDYWICFVGGPLTMQNHRSNDPAFHLDCARYALQVCPYIVRPRAERGLDAGPLQSPERPDVFGLAVTRNFKFGPLGFKFSAPVRIEWWRNGRPVKDVKPGEVPVSPPKDTAQPSKPPPFDLAPLRNIEQQCEGKVRHGDRDSALTHAKAAGHEYQVYACPWCRGWHVGHAKGTLVTSERAR
jgi:hypothetical protein